MGRTILVVAGVLWRDGKVLIGQRMAKDRYGLRWEFPGGKMEPGETPKQALQRELREELDIEAEIGLEIARYEQHNGRAPFSLLLLFHRVDSWIGEPKGREFEQILWEEPGNLPSYDFLDGDVDFVRRLSQGRIRLT